MQFPKALHSPWYPQGYQVSGLPALPLWPLSIQFFGARFTIWRNSGSGGAGEIPKDVYRCLISNEEEFDAVYSVREPNASLPALFA